MTTIHYTLAAQILEFVRDNPGITGDKIHEQFLPGATKSSISNTLGRLRRQGVIKNSGSWGPRTEWYAIQFRTPEDKFLEHSRIAIAGMKKLPKSEREAYLARFMQNL